MKRYIILIASLVMQLCLGGLYAWSAFVPGLADGYGMSQTQTQLIFGLTIASFTIAMVWAGRLQDRHGPRPIAITGGILFGLGYLLASFSAGAFVFLLIGIGIIAGAGIGFGYVCPLATCVKWFPEHKGLVTGLAVAGFGAGAIVLSAVARVFFANERDVLELFRWIGIWYGVAVVAAALLLSNPPHFKAIKGKAAVKLGQLLRDRAFWSLVIGMLAGTFAGLLVIGNLAPIGLSAGVSAAVATAAISSFAVGNAIGRVSWGYITDKIGRISIPASLFCLAVSVALLIPGFSSGWFFIIIAALMGFGFGACFVVYVAQTVTDYGAEVVGSIYPLVFLAYGASGILGPTTGGWFYDISGSYMLAAVAAAAISAAGAFFSHLLRSQKASKQEQEKILAEVSEPA